MLVFKQIGAGKPIRENMTPYMEYSCWMDSKSYNPWPLGKLPEEMRRPEPQRLKELGYHWEDPRDIVGIFEEKLADYAGSKYAVTTDSCSNAIFLALKYKKITGKVVIPKNTYASVPMQIIHAGAKPVFEHYEWQGIYPLGDSGIWDSAARFTKGMYVGGEGLQCLSFQIKKRLPIGRGGAILTDNFDAYQKLKLMTYDGRDLTTAYDSKDHVKSLGWHFYLTPEDSARGILLMDMLPEHNPDTMTSDHYPDLTQWPSMFNLLHEQGKS